MPKKPALQPEMVHEFVNEAHGNLGRVRELLEQEPALLNAAWDWGGGDWETGLGAAAHMGKKDIALHYAGKARYFRERHRRCRAAANHRAETHHGPDRE